MSGAATSATAPIPYRSASAVNGTDVASSLGLTLVVLAAFALSAWFVRRRGWLDRWLPSAGGGDRPRRQLQVMEVLALSRKTRLLRVRRGDREWLLAESEAGIQVIRPEDGEQAL